MTSLGGQKAKPTKNIPPPKEEDVRFNNLVTLLLFMEHGASIGLNDQRMFRLLIVDMFILCNYD